MKALLATLVLSVPTAMVSGNLAADYLRETSKHRDAAYQLYLNDKSTVDQEINSYVKGLTINTKAFQDQWEACVADPANVAKVETLVTIARSRYRKAKDWTDYLQANAVISGLGDSRPGALDDLSNQMREHQKMLAYAEADLAVAEAMLALQIESGVKR